MAFDPYQPYGPLVETTLRVVTWNVWGRYGAADERQRALEAELEHVDPDVVCLVEAWSTKEVTQPELIRNRLGLADSLFVDGWVVDDWTSGIGVVSRWPIEGHERRPLRGDDGNAVGEALFATVDGPRGSVQLFVAVLTYPLHGSGVRQAQVRELCAFIADKTSARNITVVCGDFNAGPDSDEMRMLTGRSAPPVKDLVFYDAWEMAGDGTPGITWSNQNPLAAVGQYPDRRFDYILSAWPRLGAAGQPVRCELLGVRDDGGQEVSDHYGVVADLRY